MERILTMDDKEGYHKCLVSPSNVDTLADMEKRNQHEKKEEFSKNLKQSLHDFIISREGMERILPIDNSQFYMRLDDYLPMSICTIFDFVQHSGRTLDEIMRWFVTYVSDDNTLCDMYIRFIYVMMFKNKPELPNYKSEMEAITPRLDMCFRGQFH